MWGPPPRPSKATDKLKEPKPKNIREVPGYLKRLTTKFFSRLFYIFRLVWDAKPWILFVMLGNSVLSGIFPVIGSIIAAKVLNALADVITGSIDSFRTILVLLCLQFAYSFAVSLINTVYSMIIRIANELVANEIKIKIISKAREIDLKNFDMPEFYEKMENANREASVRPISTLSAIFSIISVIISVASFIVILAKVSPFAPLLMIALAAPSAVISYVYRTKNFLYMRRRSRDRREMNYYSDVLVDNNDAKEVRIFSLSDTFIKCFRDTFERYFGGLRKLIVSEGTWNIGISVVSTAVNCGLFLYIARKVYDGILKVGDYSLYTGALSSISNGVSTLISTTATIYEGTLFIDNMIVFMNEEPTIVPLIPDDVLHVKRHVGHTIEFRDVSFRYPGTERMIIKHMNLYLAAGETAVLVGLNGAGKTTLIKLMTRLYDPTEGVILLDGEDIRRYDVHELYDMFGIIFQDFGKYAFPVRDNIAFGQVSKEIDENEIRDAAKQSSADAFIDKLPKDYDTPLMRYFDDDGIELSIGQWQKLSIARAFYSDSDVLILDEPTASLDPMAEQDIFNQFDRLREDKTTIFVSHRLSSATVASKIIVLEDGMIVEEGNHRELMAKRGKYYELFSTQAMRYVMDEAERADAEKRGAERSPEQGHKGQFAHGDNYGPDDEAGGDSGFMHGGRRGPDAGSRPPRDFTESGGFADGTDELRVPSGGIPEEHMRPEGEHRRPPENPDESIPPQGDKAGASSGR